MLDTIISIPSTTTVYPQPEICVSQSYTTVVYPQPEVWVQFDRYTDTLGNEWSVQYKRGGTSGDTRTVLMNSSNPTDYGKALYPQITQQIIN